MVISCGPVGAAPVLPELESESDGRAVVGVAEGSDSVVLTSCPSNARPSGSGRDHIGDGLAERDRAAVVRGIARAVDGAPRTVAHGRQAVLPARLLEIRAQCTDPPTHRARPARAAVEGVELALVEDVRIDDL